MGGIKRPLLILSICFGLGIAFAQQVSGSAIVWAAIAGALSIGGVYGARYLPFFSFLIMALAFIATGIGVAQKQAAVTEIGNKETEQLLEGEVEGASSTNNHTTRFLLRVQRIFRHNQWEDVHFRVRISSEEILLLSGDRVRLRACLRPLRIGQNPGDRPMINLNKAQGIIATGYVREKQIAVLGKAPFLQSYIHQLRIRYRIMAEKIIADSNASALLRALALGDRTNLSDEVNDDFNRSGLAHILSVSGLHIAIVAAGFYRFLCWLTARFWVLIVYFPAKVWASALAIPVTWAYVLITGSEIPAVRSGIMISFIFLARLLRRDPDAPTAVGAALMAVLAYDPAAWHSISFRLSFSAVAGLMILTPHLRNLIPIARPSQTRSGIGGWLKKRREALLVVIAGSMAASLATGPLVAATFQRTSLIAVISNVIALPVASALTVIAASSAAIFMLYSTAAIPLIALAKYFSQALLFFSHWFSSLPYSSLLVPSPSLLFFVAWYCVLFALIIRNPFPRFAKRIGLISSAILVLLSIYRWVGPLFRRSLIVTFLSVGQGDASIVQFPGGKNLLIDGGGDVAGKFDTGSRIVVPALLEMGISKLDAIVLSHPHPDHILGLGSVIDLVPVKEIWIARGTKDDSLLDQLLEKAQNKQIPIRQFQAGQIVSDFSPVHIEIIHPLANKKIDPQEETFEANDYSLVLRIKLKEVSFLFTGDIESLAEKKIIARHSPFRANVLKAPHHGSNTSSTYEFIYKVRPQHVVFSVGQNNRYQFPRPTVMNRYSALGAALHRTDSHGAVTFTTNGNELEVSHYVGD